LESEKGCYLKVAGQVLQRIRTAVRRLDARAKLLLLLLISIACFYHSSLAALVALLGVAALWAFAAGGPAPPWWKRVMFFVWPVAIVAIAFTWGRGWILPWLLSLLRLFILQMAGRAFGRSTPPDQLAGALQKLHCPRILILVSLVVRNLLPSLRAEVRLAYDTARVKTASERQRRFRRIAALAWHTMLTLCSRLFIKADELTAMVESQAAYGFDPAPTQHIAGSNGGGR